MIWTLVTFIGFTVLVAVISYLKTKGDDQTTADGYFLAGRGLPGFVIAGSLLLTNLSAEQLVGTNGQTWLVGMSPMAFEIVAAPCCIVLALWAAPRYLKGGITTIPQLIGQRFGRSTKLWFSIAYIILYLVVQIPVILYSGSLVFENIFHVSDIFGLSTFGAVVVLCIVISIVGSIYAIFGGLKAVAVSDTVNGVGLLIGGFMIPFFALHVLGNAAGYDGVAIVDGFKYLAQTYPEKLNSIGKLTAEAPEVPWITVFTGLIFLGLQSWCTHQSFIQRVLAAENLKEAQKGALYCAFLKIIGFMYLALPGVIAYALFELHGNQVSMMDAAYPQLVTEVIPAPLMGFFAAVMFGAILSSFNSVLNSVNTMFTMDIYHEYINPEASEMKLVQVGKNIGIVFAVATTIVGPMVYFFPAGLKTFLDSFVMLIGLPVLSAVFGGFFFKYLPQYAAKLIMVFHIICYGLFLIIAPQYPVVGGSIHYLYAILVLWPIELLIMAFLNYKNKKDHPDMEAWEQEDVHAVDMTPWRYRKVCAVAIIALCIIVYAAFSPLGLGA
ncbi:solute:sodium symporter family transporter [Butyricicoccus sp.]|uniref:solute:sodium symporter family transporter n=1 Tax=Butyricicoccus sp. TaxID=2049021 RepID=UPI002E9FF301|nr:solute:sodium symporter family transporter [Butyricicoccus sp.]